MQQNNVSQAQHSRDVRPSRGQRFAEWLQDPLGSTIAACLAVIGSFGFVLSGIWLVNVSLS